MKVSILLFHNKRLSRAADILILMLVKLSRLRNIFSGSTGHPVIISFHKLGDSVFTIPALREIEKKFNKFYIFCFEETVPIFKLFFSEQDIISFQHSDFLLNDRIARSNIRKKLKNINPEIIYDLTGSVLSASILFNSDSKEIIGVNANYYKNIYSQHVPIRTSPHILDIYLDAAGVEDSKRKALKEFELDFDKDGYIAIHPFAGWESKEWNLNKFIELAERLNKNYNVVLVTVPGKIEEDVKNEIEFKGITIAETRDIKELIAVLKDCSLIVANDSGPLYIANCLGKPTFAIYGPTNPVYHVPSGPGHRFIQKILKCSPVHQKYCFTNAGRMGCPSFDCMNLLETDEVFIMLSEFIPELGIKPKEADQRAK